jgi:uncharacterized delta-60 repeat protein
MPAKTGPKIPNSGLVFHVDAADINSYVSGSTTWYNLAGTSNGTLTNGPSYSINNKGILSFDGVDDYVSIPETDIEDWTVSTWAYFDYDSNRNDVINLVMSTTNNSGQITYKLNRFSSIIFSSISFDTTGSIYFGSGGMGIWNEDTPTWFLHKLTPSGSLDTNFQTQLEPGGAKTMHTAYIGNDGYLYNSGTNLGNFQKRNKDTGELIYSLSAGASTISNKFVIDEDNRKVYHIGRYTSFLGETRKYVCKFDLDSYELDTTFDTSNGLNTNANPDQIFLTSDKYVYVIGKSISSYGGTSINHIIRLDQSGSLDPNFNNGGGFDDARNLICDMDSQNRLVCTGRYFSTYSGSSVQELIRINTDGTLDETFNTGTFQQLSTPSDIIVQSDDKVVVTGYFTSYSGSSVRGIVRANEDGTLDTTFQGSGSYSTVVANNLGVAEQPDGKLLFLKTGITYTTSYDGININGGFRTNTSGSIDLTYDTGSGFTDSTQRSNMYTRIKNTSGTVTQANETSVYPANGSRLEPQFFRDSLNGWRLVTYTKDSLNTFRMYFDGEEVYSETYSLSSYQNLDLNIDQLITSTNDIGSISIYNKVLSESEIQEIYNAQKSRFNI